MEARRFFNRKKIAGEWMGMNVGQEKMSKGVLTASLSFTRDLQVMTVCLSLKSEQEARRIWETSKEETLSSAHPQDNNNMKRMKLIICRKNYRNWEVQQLSLPFLHVQYKHTGIAFVLFHSTTLIQTDYIPKSVFAILCGLCDEPDIVEQITETLWFLKICSGFCGTCNL